MQGKETDKCIDIHRYGIDGMRYITDISFEIYDDIRDKKILDII